MQYGADVFTYERTEKGNKKVKEKSSIKAKNVFRIIILLISSLLISRVCLVNSTAPFGLALAIAGSRERKNKENLVISIGVLLGYLTLRNTVKSFWMYIIILIMITVYSYILEKKSKAYRIAVNFFTIYIMLLFYKYGFVNLTFGFAAFDAFVESIAIFPLYYILEYSFICFDKFKTKHIFTNEEIISMSITVALAIGGAWGISIFGVSITNIIGIFVVVLISFINGASIGSASGIVIGTMIGLSNSNMLIFTSIYGVCGLIAGIFKETGKYISAISTIIVYALLLIYTDSMMFNKYLEGIIAVLIFLIIPLRVYKGLEKEFNVYKKQEFINQGYSEKVKNIFMEKLDSFSGVLFNMSAILKNLADNEKLAMKGKSTALVENLADRVCENCDLKKICWKRETYQTYAAFEDLLERCQKDITTLPEELERKCIKRSNLYKHSREIMNNFMLNEMLRKRLSEGRELLATQIVNMGDTVTRIMEEFDREISFDYQLERSIAHSLNKSDINFDDIICYKNNENRLIIKLTMTSCGGAQICVKSILPVINKFTGKNMCVSDDGCNINPQDNKCTISFEEMPKFHVASYVSRMSKEGEKSNGDSYTFGKQKDGSYMIMISDGMGSGSQAGQESQAAVDLIEKFTMAGFSKATAINSVNSIMSMKFSEDEKFSTVDLGSIDLYSGEAEFMKVGAVSSFIKRKNKVMEIKSTTLPIGVLDKADVEHIQCKLESGDIVVMLSDGVVDYDSEHAGRTDWIIDYLKEVKSNNPKDIVDGLITESKKLCGGKVKDDMTAIVSKIYNVF
ncbi:MAG: stage II sporulation protein E [Clostridiaceae bacterium]